jgi:hypothetical protein
MLAFTRTLLDTWRRGVLAYDALADRVGRQFEERWLGRGEADCDALGSPDFSAVADLYSVTANVHRMRVLPCDLKSIAVLVGAAAAPFLPVLLLAVPFDELVARIVGVLL